MSAPQFGSKAHEELGALHTSPTSGCEVAEFVQENRNQKTDDQQQAPLIA